MLVLLALPVILLFSWFVLEYARIVRYTSRAKAAADVVALAAAARYADGVEVAVADANAAAGANRGPNGPLVLLVADSPGGGGDVEFGDWDESERSFAHNPAEGGRAVRVTVRFAPDHPNGALVPVLGGLLGISPLSLERSSVAVYRPPTHTTSLLLSEPAGSGLLLSGASSLRARGGIGVPNPGAGAIGVGGTAALDVPVLRLAGAADPALAARVAGVIEESASIPADPFASIAQPSIVAGAGEPIVVEGDTVVVSPGQHGSLSASAGTIVLNAGLHQFEGGIALSGSAVLQLSNATVQLAPGAPVSVTGSASIQGTCDSGAAGWSGYAIIQPAGPSTWSVQGAGRIEAEGALYAPGASVQCSDGSALSVRAAIVHSLSLAGDARARFSADIPEVALPVVPGRARLVQ